MIGKWEQFGWKDLPPQPPEDDTTFRLGARWLRDLDVEDWGCGTGWLSVVGNTTIGNYRGIDGTRTPAVAEDGVVDLAEYTSPRCWNIFMRHVLEHNWKWEKVLENALASFEQRLVLVLFTPFTRPVFHGDYAFSLTVMDGIPDLSLPRGDIVKRLEPFWWASRENLKTKTQYGVEHVFFVERQ